MLVVPILLSSTQRLKRSSDVEAIKIVSCLIKHIESIKLSLILLIRSSYQELENPRIQQLMEGFKCLIRQLTDQDQKIIKL